MITARLLLLLLSISPLQIMAAPSDPDILIYDEGSTQVNTEINQYEKLVAGSPIRGSVFITHNKNTPVDPSSFHLGDKPLPTEFVQSAPMASPSNLEVTIYKFQIDGMKAGMYTLPSIKVKVGNKVYEAQPMTVQVSP